jgi:hypothetical protein
MLFDGDPVRVIGTVDADKIDELRSKIVEKFNNHWVKRTFKLMDSSYCLKAITPSKFDVLDEHTAEKLREILIPWVQPYVSKNEKIVYLDVSSLPPGAQSLVHVDYSWIHLMAKRIRIPIITNPKSTFALWTDGGEVKTYNLKVGNVYETNNSVMHLAANLGDTDRWHIVADILDIAVYDYLVRENKLSGRGLHPSINFSLNPAVIEKLTAGLHAKPLDD